MSDDELLADAELLFFPAYTQPYHDPEELAHVRFRKVVGDALAAAEARGYQRAVDLVAQALDVAKAEPHRPPTDRAGRICALGQILADLLDAESTPPVTAEPETRG